jgi:hypothetical protein
VLGLSLAVTIFRLTASIFIQNVVYTVQLFLHVVYNTLIFGVVSWLGMLSVLMDLQSLLDPTLLRLLSSLVEEKQKRLYTVLTHNRMHSLKILYINYFL